MEYKSEITGFGEMALDFLSEGMLILFNDGAPPELAEIAVTHKKSECPCEICVGDEVSLGDKTYTVGAVGDEVNYTFSAMGHCTLLFTDKDKPDLPGQLCLKGDGVPKLSIGDIINIKYLGGNK